MVRGLTRLKDRDDVGSLLNSREVRGAEGEVKEFGQVCNTTGA
jgi:hypothetical protein